MSLMTCLRRMFSYHLASSSSLRNTMQSLLDDSVTSYLTNRMYSNQFGIQKTTEAMGACTYTTCKGECIFSHFIHLNMSIYVLLMIRNISVFFRLRCVINVHIPSTQEWVCIHRFTVLQQPSRSYHQVFTLPETDHCYLLIRYLPGQTFVKGVN